MRRPTIIEKSAKPVIAQNPFKQEYQDVKAFFEDNLNRYEELHVEEWYSPFIYFSVKDTRWQHYPCGWRALVSFDITNGLVASFESRNRYAFARKGWCAKVTRLLGYEPRKYTDCGDKAKTTFC